jgi:flagellar motor switch protein FliN/FliY
MNPDIDALVGSAQSANPVSSSLNESTRPGAAPVRTQQFTEFEQTLMSTTEVPIDMLLDLSLPISIELGRTSMTVQEILSLGRGSVIQLDRLAGEPIDIYVSDRRFAEGEVVVLGEHFGVRITRVLANQAIGAANAA